ncbi:hypothetical protein X975_26953, partial [Stegodyphus mimosarum]
MDPDFTDTEVREAMNKLAKGKAPGLDGLNLEILIELERVVPSALRTIFNKCLEMCHFPTAWKRA